MLDLRVADFCFVILADNVLEPDCIELFTSPASFDFTKLSPVSFGIDQACVIIRDRYESSLEDVHLGEVKLPVRQIVDEVEEVSVHCLEVSGRQWLSAFSVSVGVVFRCRFLHGRKRLLFLVETNLVHEFLFFSSFLFNLFKLASSSLFTSWIDLERLYFDIWKLLEDLVFRVGVHAPVDGVLHELEPNVIDYLLVKQLPVFGPVSRLQEVTVGLIEADSNILGYSIKVCQVNLACLLGIQLNQLLEQDLLLLLGPCQASDLVGCALVGAKLIRNGVAVAHLTSHYTWVYINLKLMSLFPATDPLAGPMGMGSNAPVGMANLLAGAQQQPASNPHLSQFNTGKKP